MTHFRLRGAGNVRATPPASAAGADFQFPRLAAACDNLRNCSAFGFDVSLSGGADLRVERGGAPNAPTKITLSLDANDGVTFTTSSDRRPQACRTTRLRTESEEDGRRRVVLTDTVSADT
jgi:hypothetical protein